MLSSFAIIIASGCVLAKKDIDSFVIEGIPASLEVCRVFKQMALSIVSIGWQERPLRVDRYLTLTKP
uniref:Transcriptional regulator n=1 Tax=Panagrellus redivivus TaxID=6233 RepID=A0A7E4VBS5_PANRE